MKGDPGSIAPDRAARRTPAMRCSGPLAAMAFLAACGPRLVGDWTGTEGFEDGAGTTYYNRMSVDKDGTASISLLFPAENPEDPDGLPFFQTDLTASWTLEDEHASFDCTAIGYLWSTQMDCDLARDTMSCDLAPGLREDVASTLRWVRVQ